LVFETEAEAKASAEDLMMRWFAVNDARAVQSDDKVNYRYERGELIAV
jgi:hypothetical protein